MMLGKIPKKNSVSVKISPVISPLLPEISVMSSKENKEIMRQQRLALTLVPEKKQTILKAGLKGGSLVALGKKFATGKVVRKGSKWTVNEKKNLFFMGYQKPEPKQVKKKEQPLQVQPLVLPVKIWLKMTKKPAAKMDTDDRPLPKKEQIFTWEFARKMGFICCTHMIGKPIKFNYWK